MLVAGCHVLRWDTRREGLEWRRSPAFDLVEVEGDIAKAVGHMGLELRAETWQRKDGPWPVHSDQMQVVYYDFRSV